MLLLFDLDGTLIDSQRGIFACITHAFTDMGVAVPPVAQLRRWIGPPLRTSFPECLGNDPARIEEAVRRYRQRYLDIGWRELDVYPGIPDALEHLAEAGHQLAIVTAKPQEQAERVVEHLPFARHIRRIYGAPEDSTDHGKIERIAQALTELGSAAADTAMIGDRRYDMEGAVANKVLAVGVSWGFGDREELLRAGASIVIDNAEALRQVAEMPNVA